MCGALLPLWKPGTPQPAPPTSQSVGGREVPPYDQACSTPQSRLCAHSRHLTSLQLACLVTRSAVDRHRGVFAAEGKPSPCTNADRLSRAATCESITRLSLCLVQCQTCVRTNALRQQVGVVAAQLAPAAVGDPEAVPCIPLPVCYQAAHPGCTCQEGPPAAACQASRARRRSPRVLHEQVQAVYDPGYHAQQAGVVLRNTAPFSYLDVLPS